jgi:putative peptidoglycan lipid II flippase
LFTLSKIYKSVSIVSGATALSRVVGFARDIVCASIFGAHSGFDAFLVAFKIPNFLRRLFAEGAFSQAFVPVLSEHYAQHSEAKTLKLIDKIFGALLSATALVVIFAWVAAPSIVMIFAPGYLQDVSRYALTVQLLRITFPYLLFIALIAMISGIYNCKQRFFLPAFSPVILSCCSITMACIARVTDHSVVWLAWGVLIAGCIQLAILLAGMQRFQRLPRPIVDWRDAGVRQVLKLMSAALLGVSVVQLGLMIETFLASFLPGGSISWLYYAERLMQLPLALIAIALSTVMLPQLSRYHANKQYTLFNQSVEWALAVIVVLALPAAVGLYVLAMPILMTLFLHGQFSLLDVTMTTYSLHALSIGLPAFMLIKVAVSVFYARRDIRTPVRVAIIALLVDVLLSVVWLPFFAHAGLSAAVSSAAWVNAGRLLHLLISRRVYRPSRAIMQLLFMCATAATTMAIVLYGTVPNTSTWVAWDIMYRIMGITGYIILGGITYIATLWGIGFRPRDIRGILPAVAPTHPQEVTA